MTTGEDAITTEPVPTKGTGEEMKEVVDTVAKEIGIPPWGVISILIGNPNVESHSLQL
jgi:hypothetical protein